MVLRRNANSSTPNDFNRSLMTTVAIIFSILFLSFIFMAYTMHTAETKEDYLKGLRHEAKKDSDLQNCPPDHTP